MKNILTHIFVALGVIFVIQLVAVGYFVITDPYNLKPLLFGTTGQTFTPATNTANNTQDESSSTDETDAANDATPAAGGGFALTESQKQALISVGIDPATVPSSISASQEACFTGILGASRVAEIKAGGVPNAIEFVRVQGCI